MNQLLHAAVDSMTPEQKHGYAREVVLSYCKSKRKARGSDELLHRSIKQVRSHFDSQEFLGLEKQLGFTFSTVVDELLRDGTVLSINGFVLVYEKSTELSTACS
jgi:hypothetical protein